MVTIEITRKQQVMLLEAVDNLIADSYNQDLVNLLRVLGDEERAKEWEEA